MRTTFTIDDDVAAKVDEVRASRGLTFADVVDEALRLGIEKTSRQARESGTYRTPSTPLGEIRPPDLDDLSAALADSDGDALR